MNCNILTSFPSMQVGNVNKAEVIRFDNVEVNTGLTNFKLVVYAVLNKAANHQKLSSFQVRTLKRVYGIDHPVETMYKIAVGDRSKYVQLKRLNEYFLKELKELITLGRASRFNIALDGVLQNDLLRLLQNINLDKINNLKKLETDLNKKGFELVIKQNMNFFILLVKLFDFRIVQSPHHKMNYSKWIFHDVVDRNYFYSYYISIMEILSKNVGGVSAKDLLVKLNELNKNTYTEVSVKEMCGYIDQLEKTQDGFYRLKFSCLKRKEDKIARVLHLKQRPLTREEIVVQLNQLDQGGSDYSVKMFNGLTFRGEVQPIGRKGLYVLSSWNYNTDSLFTLIDKSFQFEKRNKLSLSNIVELIKNKFRRKDVSRASVRSIIALFSERFVYNSETEVVELLTPNH